MSTIPLRLSASLVNEARSTGDLFDRTATAQIEHWAKLGKVADAIFTNDSVAKLKAFSKATDLHHILSESDTPEAKERFAAVVHEQGAPLYRESDTPGVFIETMPDGSERQGRFVNRKFSPLRNPKRGKLAK